MDSHLKDRLNIIPDPALFNHRHALLEKLARIGDQVSPGNFPDVLRRNLEVLFRKALSDIGAHEGTIWLVNSESTQLIPVFNNGPDSNILLEQVRQPLNSGLISMVFATEQACIESEVYQHAAQDKTVDQTVGKLTCSMLATPFYFAGSLRGVFSAVQLKSPDDPKDPPGFEPEHLTVIDAASDLIGQLIDHRFLQELLGLNHG